jgi:hypothetical protein
MKLDYDVLVSTVTVLMEMAEKASPGNTDYEKGYRDAMTVVGQACAFALSTPSFDSEEYKDE